jgi:hypothetical protein
MKKSICRKIFDEKHARHDHYLHNKSKCNFFTYILTKMNSLITILCRKTAVYSEYQSENWQITKHSNLIRLCFQ